MTACAIRIGLKKRHMTCAALRLLFDYYRKKSQKPCPARLLRFFFKMPKICAISTKPLRRSGFRLDGLITPTLKAAGSNPVGRTKENPVAVTVTGFLFFLSTHKSTHFSFCLDDFRKCLFSKGSCLCQISGHLMPVGPLSIHILTVSDCHFLQSLRHLFVDADIGVPEFVERYHRDISGLPR